MKKIALAIENFSRFGGGAESYAVNLSEALIREDWQVHFYGHSWDHYPREAIFHKIECTKWLPTWAKILEFAFRHKKMAAEEHFDIVLGFGNTISMNVYQSHGGVHACSTFRKTFAQENSLLRIVKRCLLFFSLKNRVRNWIESAPFRLQPRPRVIAISQMVVDDLHSHFDVASRDVTLIYNGIDTSKHTVKNRKQLRGKLRKELGLKESDVGFLFLSYTLRKKGLLPLLRAAAHLQEHGETGFKLIVVGKQPGAAIKKVVSRLGLAEVVCFCGPCKEPEHYFANSDVLVLPTYYDTCSLVVFEAMASGLPAITTTANGASGIIEQGVNGLVVQHPPAEQELAKAMEHCLDKKKLNEMSARAAETGKHYSAKRNHQAMLQVFNEVCEVKD